MKIVAPIALAASLSACQAPATNNQAIANVQAALPPDSALKPAPAMSQGNGQTTASGLRVETLSPGSGRRPQPGDTVLVTYEGRLTDGTMFDSSSSPVPMRVGDLIPGFNEGLLLMSQSGRYRLHIPAALAYGAEGAGGVVPPNADLVFDVTLVEVVPTGGAAGR